ncbi:MAG: hypothetical protein RL708_1285 [Bacteroidota bacterium]|jgi:hypothetical protein
MENNIKKEKVEKELTIEDIQSEPEYQHLTDKQAQEMIDTITSYCEMIIQHYESLQMKEQEQKNIQFLYDNKQLKAA